MTTPTDDPNSSSRYEIFYEHAACKDLDSLSESEYRRIDEKIIALAGEPRPSGCVCLGASVFRIRVGPWRVIYIVDDIHKQIGVSRVKRRKEDTYKKLRF